MSHNEHQTLTLDILREALVGLVDDESVLDSMHYAYYESYTPARAVTEEEAAQREMQEILWVEDTIRFRENLLVSKLLPVWDPPWRSEVPVEPWMEEQFARLLHPETGNAVVRYLMKVGPRSLNHLADQELPQKDREQFTMLIGYSVDGAGELSIFSPAMTARADEVANRLRKEREEAHGS